MMASVLKRLVKRVLPHRRDYYRDRVLRRMTRRRLRGILEELGVRKGDTIFVHAQLSALGYLPDGPEGVVATLSEAVGLQGTVVMPSFPFADAMQDYLAEDPLFDVARSPSLAGTLTEAFRRTAGTYRSVHPTHPLAARGRLARDLLEGHERSETPCGPDTPFARMAPAGAVQVRLGHGALTITHHVQEMNDLPNLFLPGAFDARCLDWEGRPITVRTRSYRKIIWYAFFLGEDVDGQRMVVHARDFPLLYRGREFLYRDDPTRHRALKRLLEIRSEFERKGNLQALRANGTDFESFPVRPYLEYAIREGRALLARHERRYDLSTLERLLAAGKYPK